MRTVVGVTASALLIAACAANKAERVYVAPSNESISTSTEESRGDVASHSIWVTNGSTVPIVVYSVTLRGCENVRQSCEPRSLDLRVEPGTRALLTRVDPKVSNSGFMYRYTFAWRPAQP